MTEDDLFGFYEQRLGQIEARENQLANQERTEKVSHEIEALQQEKDYLEQFLEKITDPSYQQGEQLSLEEIKTVRGLLRRLSYDRFEVTSPGTIQADNKSRTLVILVDDNVDTKRSLIDAYRVLFKNGEARLPNSFVVAVALHQLKQPSTVK
jgi:phosphoribosylpyrophosphate synthetase